MKWQLKTGLGDIGSACTPLCLVTLRRCTYNLIYYTSFFSPCDCFLCVLFEKEAQNQFGRGAGSPDAETPTVQPFKTPHKKYQNDGLLFFIFKNSKVCIMGTR